MMRPWSSARGWTPRKSDYYRLDPIADDLCRYRLDPASDDLAEYEPVRRHRFGEAMSWLASPAGLRWVVGPLISLTILCAAAANAADRDYPYCPQPDTCFDVAGISVVYLVPSQDKTTGEEGVIVVDCAARKAMGDSPVFDVAPGSPLDALCEGIDE